MSILHQIGSSAVGKGGWNRALGSPPSAILAHKYCASVLAGSFHSATFATFDRSLRLRSTQSPPRFVRRCVEPPAAPSAPCYHNCPSGAPRSHPTARFPGCIQRTCSAFISQFSADIHLTERDLPPKKREVSAGSTLTVSARGTPCVVRSSPAARQCYPLGPRSTPHGAEEPSGQHRHLTERSPARAPQGQEESATETPVAP